MWQDITITFANIIFIAAMLPQIYYSYKTKKGVTSLFFSLLNILAMISLIVVYTSLNYYSSVATNSIIISLWFVLVIQRIKYGKVKK